MLVLVLVGLAFTVYVVAQTFDAPTVEKVSTEEIPLTEGAGGGAEAIPVVIGNESEEADGTPEWWYWSREDFEKLQRYANQTEIQWSKDDTGMTYGKIVVTGEPLYKGYACKNCPNYMPDENMSPVAYLDGERRGHCFTVPVIYYYLQRIEGENVKFTGAANIDYNLDMEGGVHFWIEWTDSEDNEWVANFDKVMPKDYWYQKYNWTVNWKQLDDPQQTGFITHHGCIDW